MFCKQLALVVLTIVLIKGSYGQSSIRIEQAPIFENNNIVSIQLCEKSDCEKFQLYEDKDHLLNQDVKNSIKEIKKLLNGKI